MEDHVSVEITQNPRKRPVKGSSFTAKRIKRLSTHKTGSDCKCSRFKCFEIVPDEEKNRIIARFNEIPSKSAQDAFLASLIDVLPVKQRRSRKDKENNPEAHDHSYTYHVNIVNGNEFIRTQVCIKGFCSIFGISTGRIRHVRQVLASTGETCL